MSYERRVLLHHSAASIVALGITGLTRLVYNVVIARKFGIEELGRTNSLISQAFLLAIPLGFFAVAVGKYSSEFLGREKYESIRSITAPSFLFPLAGIALVPLNAYVALLAVFRATQLTLRSFLYGIHRGEHYAYAVSLAFVAFLAGFLLPDALAPYVLFLGAVFVFSWLYLFRFRLIGRPSLQEFRMIASYSAFAFLGTLSGVFLIQGPYFMSEKLSGPEVAGVVSAVLSTVFLLTYLPQVLQSAIMPLFAFKFGKNDDRYIKRLAEESTVFLIVATSTMVFALMLFGRELLSAVFSFDIGPSFYVALLAVEVYISYNPSIVALNSTSYVNYGTALSLAGALTALFLWPLLIPAFAENGVMVGLLAAYAVILLGVAYFSRRLLGISSSVYRHLVVSLVLQATVFVSKLALAVAFVAFVAYEWKTIIGLINRMRSFE